MNLSISNIAWSSENDEKAYSIMKQFGFTGLEIAPTRIFHERPYENLTAAKKWASELNEKNGYCLPSMQSIWYGRQEKIFGSEEERRILADYTCKAIDFAEAIGCKNLVFGCPRNRNCPDGTDTDIAVDFFREIGDYAARHHTVIGMEANPVIYNTNFINTTRQAFDLIREVDSAGFKLNLDLGTMIYNSENVAILEENADMINHVHISEPGLKPVVKRPIHNELAEFLKKYNYKGFVSIEMGRQDDMNVISEVCGYVKEVFA